VALGVGVAGVAAGGLTGGLAVAKKSTASSDCTAQGVCGSQTGVDAGNTARGLANAATITLVVGGLGLATALALALTEPATATPTVRAGLQGVTPWMAWSW